MREMPFFLTNEDWYTVDPKDDERGYKLTDKAPQEAIESYNKLYSNPNFPTDTQQDADGRYVFD